jgi:Fe-S-cluster containining protein
MDDSSEQKISNTSQPITLHLDKLEEKLAGGLQFTNMLSFMNQENYKNIKTLLYSLVELLVSKGVIHLHEIEERKQVLAPSFEKSETTDPQIYLIDTPDKYSEEGQVEIDCPDRYHLCKAACCKLWFALSVQDLDERVVKWNYSRPYGIAQRADGYCVHLDQANYGCKVYKNRPLICRTYDCRQDKRIWLDFENKIVNPNLNQKDWPRSAAMAETQETEHRDE